MSEVQGDRRRQKFKLGHDRAGQQLAALYAAA
jgi:hypothetical protein